MTTMSDANNKSKQMMSTLHGLWYFGKITAPAALRFLEFDAIYLLIFTYDKIPTISKHVTNIWRILNAALPKYVKCCHSSPPAWHSNYKKCSPTLFHFQDIKTKNTIKVTYHRKRNQFVVGIGKKFFQKLHFSSVSIISI